VLWNRTMGTTVLDAGAPNNTAVRLYAHCIKATSGGVTVLALNTDTEEHALQVPLSGERFTLTAPALNSTAVLLNGRTLKTKADGSLPSMKGNRFKPGIVSVPAHSITFLTIPSADNDSCK